MRAPSTPLVRSFAFASHRKLSHNLCANEFISHIWQTTYINITKDYYSTHLLERAAEASSHHSLATLDNGIAHNVPPSANAHGAFFHFGQCEPCNPQLKIRIHSSPPTLERQRKKWINSGWIICSKCHGDASNCSVSIAFARPFSPTCLLASF